MSGWPPAPPAASPGWAAQAPAFASPESYTPPSGPTGLPADLSLATSYGTTYGADYSSGFADLAWTPDLTDLMLGQKSLIYGILLSLISWAIRLAVVAVVGPVTIFSATGGILQIVSSTLGLASTFCALYGIYQLSRSLGYAVFTRILLFGAMFIPLVSLLVMLRLNALATKKLRAGGYTVGLLGATQN